jgi:hypothetical protein
MKEIFRKAASKANVFVRGNPLCIGLIAATATGAANAQTTIDVSSVTATVLLGVAAASLIGAAWVGLKYLKKVWGIV